MTNYYCVVQYLPDPVIDERINIGVVAFGGGKVRTHFLSNWQRVRSFGGDVKFLREFASELSRRASPELVLPELTSDRVLSHEQLQKVAERWINSVQFTPPRASLQEIGDLVQYASKRFLREPKRQRRAYRGKQSAVRAAFEGIRSALQDLDETLAHELLHRKYPLEGSLEHHKFDVVVANGRPFFAAQALSFENPDAPLETEVDAAAFAISDVRKRHRELPVAVVALPPKKRSKAYDRARHIFEALDTDMLKEDEVEGWAESKAELIPLGVQPMG